MPYDSIVREFFNRKKGTLIVISNATISPQLLEIIKQMKDRTGTFEVYVVAEVNNPLLQSIQDLKINYKVLQEVSKYKLYRYFLRMLWVVFRMQPDVVLSSGQHATFFTMPAAFFLKVPKRIYIRHHSHFHHKYKLYLGLILDHLMNFFATKIVAVSLVVKEVLILEKVPLSKIEVIYNGIELSSFREVRKSRALQHERSIFQIGVISRLTEWKGVEYTAKAFRDFNRRYPNSSLHIIGAQADATSDVLEVLKDLPQDSFEMQLQNLDIPSFFAEMDVFIHVPTERADEAFGIVYVEALAAGVPSIFTKSGIICELSVPEKFCSVVPYKQSIGIFQSLEKIYNKEMLFEEIPLGWLAQFDLKAQGSNYVRLLTD